MAGNPELDEIKEDGTYLGDGLYARYDAMVGMIGLFTTDGIDVTNRVYLEGFVLAAFLRFLKNLGVKL